MATAETHLGRTAGLLSLDDPACEDPGLSGNKAATLSVLRRVGFEVPPGVVVTSEALGAIDDELPVEVQAALMKAPEVLGPGPWAVRSSSTAEDSERASFAGQFETSLGVGQEELVEAVLNTWRSGSSDRVKAYGPKGDGAVMAVLIQPMIAAETAGVAFTIDPVSGQRRTVIEAVEGLGERLVSGEVTPERWTIEGDATIQSPATPTVLDLEQARSIAGLAARVESHFGSPQDIEWAIAGGSLWLLQARPITAHPRVGPDLIPIPIAVPPGSWTRDAFHEPVPISPFGKVMLTEQILKVFPAVAARFGLLIERAEVAYIGGWIYNRLVPVGAPAPRSRGGGRTGAPPRWLLAILMRLHPEIRRRNRAARTALESDLPYAVVRRWFDEWRPEIEEDYRRALALDLGSLSDRELDAQLKHRIEVVGQPAHAMVGIAWNILVYDLAELGRRLLGWDTAKTLSLLEGLSTTTTEPARRLGELAELARRNPAFTDLLSSIDATTADRLAGVDPGFAQAFSLYVEATGHRAIRFDVVDPTLAETPQVLLRLVADQLEGDFSASELADQTRQHRERTVEEARWLLSSHPEVERARFERALDRAVVAYPTMEDKTWHTQAVQTALLRYLGLEIGRRLVERNQLDSVEDVFFLEVDEARSALFDGTDGRETVRVRRGERAWAIANPGPLTRGDQTSAEPPFDLLPEPARLVNQAVVWGVTQFFGTPASRGAAPVTGTPASAGRYTGTVRLVMGEHQFAKIKVGDVVVSPTTSPVWSIVFPSLGALVTDAGGILSHPAIIAREYRIPAVVGTGNATQVLRDGQRVTVDGNTGLVEFAPPPET